LVDSYKVVGATWSEGFVMSYNSQKVGLTDPPRYEFGYLNKV